MSRKLLLAFFLSGLMLSLAGQERLLTGKVFDNRSKAPLDSALVKILRTDVFRYTDSAGAFSIPVPRPHGNVLVTHEGYLPDNRPLKAPYWKRPIYFGMVSEHRQKADRTKYDSVWRTVSNAFYIHPFELIIGSLGLEYEHFFTTKHAAGIHSSFYLLGWGYSWNTVDHELNRFSGFKLAPYYRHYFHRTAYHGFFVEGRPEVGYFKMDPLLYRYWLTSFWFTGEYLTQGKKMEFWTGGISVNLGFDARFAKAPKGLFTFSIGLQYFPLRAPKNLLVPDEYGNVWYYERNENWWYFGGPGSIIQVKLGYGGIF